jgi:hypothetical protein
MTILDGYIAEAETIHLGLLEVWFLWAVQHIGLNCFMCLLYFIHRVGVIKTTPSRKLVLLPSSGEKRAQKPNILAPLDELVKVWD